MAYVIDVRPFGGELKIVGDGFSLPVSNAYTIATSEPSIGALRYNPDISGVEVYAGNGAVAGWTSVSVGGNAGVDLSVLNAAVDGLETRLTATEVDLVNVQAMLANVALPVESLTEMVEEERLARETADTTLSLRIANVGTQVANAAGNTVSLATRVTTIEQKIAGVTIGANGVTTVYDLALADLNSAVATLRADLQSAEASSSAALSAEATAREQRDLALTADLAAVQATQANVVALTNRYGLTVSNGAVVGIETLAGTTAIGSFRTRMDHFKIVGIGVNDATPFIQANGALYLDAEMVRPGTLTADKFAPGAISTVASIQGIGHVQSVAFTAKAGSKIILIATFQGWANQTVDMAMAGAILVNGRQIAGSTSPSLIYSSSRFATPPLTVVGVTTANTTDTYLATAQVQSTGPSTTISLIAMEIPR